MFAKYESYVHISNAGFGAGSASICARIFALFQILQRLCDTHALPLANLISERCLCLIFHSDVEAATNSNLK